MSTVKNQKLTEQEVQERLATYAKTRDVSVRDEIVLQYTNLVESIARRFVGACEPVEDLIQEGYIGLITAVNHYDITKGVKFSTYATHFIIGEIKHYLRDKGKIIKEPAWLQELNQRMMRVVESLSQKFGRQPTESEIGAVMDLPEEMVRELLMTREIFKVSSLDAERDENHPSPVDPEKIKDQKLVTFQLPVEDKIVLETAMERLKSIEQRVIYEFYYLDLNQTEIARKLGISCNYVSHILRNSTKKLKKILMTDEIKDSQMQLALMSRRLAESRGVVERQTVVDSVTGLYNRKHFLARLEEEVSRSFRYKHHLAVVVVELKMPEQLDPVVQMIRFDDVMSRAAGVVLAQIRKVDLAARYSENVIALILPHTGKQAGSVCQRLADGLGELEVEGLRGSHPVKLQVKIGHARYPADGTSAGAIIRAALDRAGIVLEEQPGDAETVGRAA